MMYVPCPDQRGQKQWLIRVICSVGAGERNDDGSHTWEIWGVPAVTEACRKLLRAEGS